jgi:hypothetical protein
MSRTAQNCEEGGFYADLVKKGQAFFAWPNTEKNYYSGASNNVPANRSISIR